MASLDEVRKQIQRGNPVEIGPGGKVKIPQRNSKEEQPMSQDRVQVKPHRWGA